MSDLSGFLLARYDELEALAHTVEPLPPVYDHYGDTAVQSAAELAGGEGAQREVVDLFLSAADPAYVLADIAAKRRIVDLATNQHTRCVEYDEILPILALPFADHPDYDERWRP